jgi:hypothetical protein
LTKLREKGNLKTVSGGTKILQELDFTENTSSGWYSGWDTLTVAPVETMTAAEFAIKEAYVTMAISGLEIAQNRGKEAMFDLMEARIKNGERTLNNLLAVGVYSATAPPPRASRSAASPTWSRQHPLPAPWATSTAQRIRGGGTCPRAR